MQQRYLFNQRHVASPASSFYDGAVLHKYPRPTLVDKPRIGLATCPIAVCLLIVYDMARHVSVRVFVRGDGKLS